MSHIQEEWKSIPSFTGAYSVSDGGRVYSHLTNRLISIRMNHWGYARVQLMKEGKSVSRFVHCLVAEAFFGTKPLGFEVNHIDGVKGNNQPFNLEYVIKSENIRHALRLGLMKPIQKKVEKLTDDDVRFIRSTIGSIGCKRLAKMLGVSDTYIKDIRKGYARKNVS